MSVEIRQAKPSDIPFIYSSWLYSLYNGSQYELCSKDTFMREYRSVIDHILSKPTVLVHVACLDDDKDTIVGFGCTEYLPEGNALHFVYVKKMWRGNNLGHDLVPQIKYYTHITRQFLSIKPKDLKYNPFLIGK